MAYDAVIPDWDGGAVHEIWNAQIRDSEGTLIAVATACDRDTAEAMAETMAAEWSSNGTCAIQLQRFDI